jgi:hypothetical protein
MDPEYFAMPTDALRALAASRATAAQTMVCDLAANMMAGDMKRNHADIRLFWPYGLDEIPGP